MNKAVLLAITIFSEIRMLSKISAGSNSQPLSINFKCAKDRNKINAELRLTSFNSVSRLLIRGANNEETEISE